MTDTTSPQPQATFRELLDEIPGARIVRGTHATVIHDVRHDSRDVQPGDAFVPRRGQHDDGARFIADAIARGAGAILSDRDVPGDVAVLYVPDPELALALASSAVWRHPTFAVEVIGITGTNGKTTTAWLLEQALESLGQPTGLLGTVEHRFRSLRWPALHTTPEADDVARRAAAMRDAGATHLVMEVSSHALVLKRAHAVRFRVAVLTNVTQDHLDFHGTFASYADAKRSLFLERGPAMSVVNIDDPVGRSLLGRVGQFIGYSARGAIDATLRVTSATFDPGGIRAEIVTPEGPVVLTSTLVGRHNLENALAALGTLIALDIPAARAVEALAHAKSAPGRLERVVATSPMPDAPAVFVDYAHTPDALMRVLAALRAAAPRRLICVFGCGGDRDPGKRGPMGEAVARGADVAVLTTDNPRTEDPAIIARAAELGLRAGGLEALTASELDNATRGYLVELDRHRAIEMAISHAGAGDVILLAGKGHEPYQEVHGVRSPFDDRIEARNALEGRR